jgi:hypothetical protein
VPPLTDVIGHLLETGANVRIRTKSGDDVDFSPDDVVTLRILSDKPVRASEIRALEHADALAWRSAERQWLGGWLLRAGPGDTHAANSAVPLDISATQSAIPAIVDWYRQRGLVPRLAVPERLLRLPDEGELPHWMMVCELRVGGADAIESPAAAVTDAPDGTRWVGLASLRELTRESGEALLAWGASQGATRGYVRVSEEDHAAADLAQSLGFVLHHHARYITVAALT